MHLPSEEESLWRESYDGPVYPELKNDIQADVAVVGAGITGLSCAYFLKRSGMTVAVVDKDSVGGGTTGRTTGKVTSQQGLIYAELVDKLGKKKAGAHANHAQQALKNIKTIINNEKIDCDWQVDDNYIFTTDGQRASEFRKEAKTCKMLGLPASFETDTPLPFKVRAAVKFGGQAKFNAQKYLLGLARAVNGGGSFVFEKSPAIYIKEGNPGRVSTRKGKIRANYIIVATNVPTLPQLARATYCLFEYPTESYIVAGRPKQRLEGMYISPDEDNYSILPFKHGNMNLLLIGGGGNISGMRLSKSARYEKLARYGQEHFGLSEITHTWSDRDYIAYDRLPMAGRLYPWSKSRYVATAYRKWGLTNATACALLLSDLIQGKKNELADIYNPHRTGLVGSIPRHFSKNYRARA